MIIIIKKIRQIRRELAIRYAYLRKWPVLPYLPPFIAIEPTNYCNYKCLMCPQSSKKADLVPRGFMSPELFMKIIAEVKNYTFEVFIQLGGEPLLHPRLMDFISLAKKENLIVGISTNASLLTRESGRALLRAGLDKMVITFTDKGKERYEAIWQAGDYNEVEENIKQFLGLKKSRGKPEVMLQVIKFFKEDGDLALDKEFIKTWQSHGVNSFSPIWATYWAGGFREEAESRYGEAPRDSYYIACGAIWRSLAIHWDGKVSACCNDLSYDYIVGDVNNEPLSCIWNNEKMVTLRQCLSRGGYKEIELCQHCLALWGRLPEEKRRWYGALENRVKRNV